MHPTIGGIPNNVTYASNNSLTYVAGGGADVGLTHRFALRGQVDWLHNGFQTFDNQRRFEEIHQCGADLDRRRDSLLMANFPVVPA